MTKSRRLFLTQVERHVELLGELLAIAPQERVERAKHEQVRIATRMLANSASLLDLPEWNQFLSAYETLLVTYADRNLPWDERVAQVTSEIIEREDRLIRCGVEGRPLSGALQRAEVDPLLAELTAVQDLTWELEIPMADDEATENKAAAAETDADGAPEPRYADQPLGNSMGDLYVHTETLLAACAASNWDMEDDGNLFTDIRRLLFLITFHALSVEQIIRLKAHDQDTITIGTLEPIRSTIEDFARVLSTGTERRIDVGFRGEDNPLDARLMFPAVRVLQCMIHDVFTRCADEYLHIVMSVENRHGRLEWAVRDNGSNFITDSRLDRDEFLAFYPRLKESSRVLADLDSVLWVEPDENHDTRFKFTTPFSLDETGFMLWGGDDQHFAVFTHQYCDVLSVTQAGLANDARGEHIVENGMRIPVVRLGHLYTGAPVDGEYVAVIGRLEKRIGFYVPDNGRLGMGQWLRKAVPAWRELRKGAALVDGTQIPVVEAEALIHDYLSIINAADDVSGAGGTDDAGDAPRDGAVPDGKIGVGAEPRTEASADDGVDVLVIERSEGLRTVYETIIADHHISARIVSGLEDAMACLDHKEPRLIISDFRVPTMAAKAIAERLRNENREIPILVTTTHSGNRARALVNKLGVAGHISKPLNPSDVVERVEAYCKDALTPAPSG